MKHATLIRASRPRRAPGIPGCVPVLLLAALAGCGDSAGGGGAGGGGGDGGAGDGGSGGAAIIEKPARFRLRLDDAPVPSLVLELDKEKALKLFGEDGARQIRALEVDTTPLLTNAINQIQDACGTAWRANVADPHHDCSSTTLFPVSGDSWRTSPAFALIRLLTMTPANAGVRGTSLEGFKNLLDDNPSTFRDSFGDVLAQSLGIARTDPFIPTGKLIEALQKQLLASHPAISDPTGKVMTVSLFEALRDLAPLSQKLGPVGTAPWSGTGEHPGVLVPDDGTFTTYSNVLENFKMRVVAESALRRVPGIDLSRGGGDMFLQEGDAPLKFDFNDTEKLQITGIAETPIVNMRFAMRELNGVVPSCTAVPSCKANLPASPVGSGTVWTLKPFLLEPIVTRAALLTYEQRTYGRCFIGSSAPPDPACNVGVGIGWLTEPLGWSVFASDIVIGGRPIIPPAPQFLWELLTEVAQVSVHNPSGDGSAEIDEGNAQPVYTLHNVGIGLTSAEIIAKLRPTLQSQAQTIAEIILGRYWVENDALDFYYSRGAPGGDPYLFFVTADDLRPDDQGSDMPRAYGYAKPGFFKTPDLAEESKVSSKVVDGSPDTTHEKYKLSPGASTLYMQDDEGASYEVRFHVPENGDPVEITADVKRL